MERIILNTAKSPAELYIISNEYLLACNKRKKKNPADFIEYLERSEYFQIFLNTNKDIFNQLKVDDYRTLKTNGRWFWSADLNFYSKNHSFEWPEDFITFWKNNKDVIVSADNIDEDLGRKVIDLFAFRVGHADIKKENLLQHIIIQK